MNKKTVKLIACFGVAVIVGNILGLLSVKLTAGEKQYDSTYSASAPVNAALVDRLEFRMSMDRIIEILGEPESIIEKRKTPSNDNAEKKRMCYTLTDGSQYVVIINRHDELVAGGITAPVIANR